MKMYLSLRQGYEWVAKEKQGILPYAKAVHSAEIVRAYSNIKSKVYKIGDNGFCRGLLILIR